MINVHTKTTSSIFCLFSLLGVPLYIYILG